MDNQSGGKIAHKTEWGVTLGVTQIPEPEFVTAPDGFYGWKIDKHGISVTGDSILECRLNFQSAYFAETGEIVEGSRADTKQFILVAVTIKTGKETLLTLKPCTEREALTMKSKFTFYPEREIVMREIEPGEDFLSRYGVNQQGGGA